MNLYENQNQMLEALNKKDLNKILKGIFYIYIFLGKNKKRIIRKSMVFYTK